MFKVINSDKCLTYDDMIKKYKGYHILYRYTRENMKLCSVIAISDDEDEIKLVNYQSKNFPNDLVSIANSFNDCCSGDLVVMKWSIK